jgi:hypothetical protein
MRRKLLIATAAVLVLVVAAVVVVRFWLTRDDTAPVAVDQVVKDYRDGATTPTATTPQARAGGPAAGVYAYTTTGGEQTTILGTSHHDYPAVTTIAIRPTDCGYTQTWTALDKRSETWTMCKRDDGLQPQSLRDVHSFYAHTDDRRYACTGDAVFPLERSVGEQTVRCATSGSDATTMTEVAHVAGRERIDVGGTTVDAVHVHIAQTLTGETKGTGTVDWWLEPKTGLLVRAQVANQSTSATPIGKDAPYEEQFTLKLRALTPQG